MSEFGQTGRWLFLPVIVCVGFVGALAIYSFLPDTLSIIIRGMPFSVSPNGVATVFARDPPLEFYNYYPNTSEIPKVTWMGNLVFCQGLIIATIGIVSVGALLCPLPTTAKLLYYLSLLHIGLWGIVHAGVFYCHRKVMLLDFDPQWRGSITNTYAIFGQLDWPESFWYNYAFRSLLFLFMFYNVCDLYKSWYLILKVGGSGWEGLAARDLPGWNAYEDRLKALEKAKYGLEDEEEEDVDVENQTQAIANLMASIMQAAQAGPMSEEMKELVENLPPEYKSLLEQIMRHGDERGPGTEEERAPMLD